MRWTLLLVITALGCGESAPEAGDGGSDGSRPVDLARRADQAVDDAATDLPVADAAAMAADGDGAATDLAARDAAGDGPPADAAIVDGAAKDGPRDAGGGDAFTTKSCFGNLNPMNGPAPDYDQFHPIVGSHCGGTNHQAIAGVEQIVFLGDSITVGTPPYLPTQYYRILLGNQLAKQYKLNPLLDVKSCAAWGARTDDVLRPPKEQIKQCFGAGPEKKRTLVVMTVGGNDLNSYTPKKGKPAQTLQQVKPQIDQAVSDLKAAIQYLTDPQHFPNGAYVVFADVYEFTDGTADVLSCPAAAAAGYDNTPWPDAQKVFVYLNEQFVKLAVDTRTDVVFMYEHFCGRGFRRDDPKSPCYRGPKTPLWFDPITCIHPNVEGHAGLANLFLKTINE